MSNLQVQALEVQTVPLRQSSEVMRFISIWGLKKGGRKLRFTKTRPSQWMFARWDRRRACQRTNARRSLIWLRHVFDCWSAMTREYSRISQWPVSATSTGSKRRQDSPPEISIGRLEKFLSPSPRESASASARGHGRMERTRHGADTLLRYCAQ